MKYTGIILFSFLLMSFTNWETNFEKAKSIATKDHKYILLNFSGSDWCGPCIRMHKEIFENESFKQFAGEKLVMMNADFPRQKKNQLAKDLQKQNDQLADKYNSKGSFPFYGYSGCKRKYTSFLGWVAKGNPRTIFTRSKRINRGQSIILFSC
jgi:thioredoxin-related protein